MASARDSFLPPAAVSDSILRAEIAISETGYSSLRVEIVVEIAPVALELLFWYAATRRRL